MVVEIETRRSETETYTAQDRTEHTLVFQTTPRDYWEVTVNGEPVPGAPWPQLKQARKAAIRHIERKRTQKKEASMWGLFH